MAGDRGEFRPESQPLLPVVLPYDLDLAVLRVNNLPTSQPLHNFIALGDRQVWRVVNREMEFMGDSFREGAMRMSMILGVLSKMGYHFPKIERITADRFCEEFLDDERKTFEGLGSRMEGADNFSREDFIKFMEEADSSSDFHLPVTHDYEKENPDLMTFIDQMPEDQEMGALVVYELKRRQAQHELFKNGPFGMKKPIWRRFLRI